MRKILYIFVLLMAVIGGYAQEQAPQAKDDWCIGKLPGYPDHYCECRNASIPFSFPLQVQVTDTMWFSATVDDLKQGLAAYWFSNCSITFEVYAFCSSKTPTITMTVSPNMMREMDVATINSKLDQMGDMAELMAQVLTPRVKVYPNGGTGTVYCYPYDQGPVSTCNEPLPIIPRMTYVCDQASEVYELKPEQIAANGLGFIRWKQKKNLTGTVRLTDGACDGPEIAQMTMADSMRVMLLNADSMLAAKQAGRSVFIHVTHPADYVGRIYYHNSIKWDVQQIDTTLCQGKKLQLNDTALSQTTIYPNDTLWKAGDTLSLTTYYLTIEPPTPIQDTLLLKAAQLPYNYNNQIIPRDGWGDYDLTIHRVDQCDERYLLHVVHDVVTRATVVDTVVCQGKTVVFGGVTYATDTVIRDSAWADADTWVTSDITIRFTEPEMEYDTLSIAPSQFTTNGYWYGELGVLVRQYGDTLIVKTKKNQCTRWIQLTVVEAEETTPGVGVEHVESTEESVWKYMHNGVLYIRREGQDYDLFGRPVK